MKVKRVKRVKKTKHGDYETRVLFPVFSNYDVLIVFTDDFQKSWNARFPSTCITSDVPQAFHWCHQPSKGHSGMFFKIGRCSAGVVAHECWHCIRTMLLDWVQTELENEVVAYHLDYLVDGVKA